MATDSQTLLNEARCLGCFTETEYGLQMLKLALLRQLVLASNPMADVTPQTLMDQARCFSCYSSSPYMLTMLELALLKQIVTNGLSSVTCGAYGGGQPNFTPASGCGNAIDTDTGTIFWFYSGAWH